jgi:DNA/RNA-binding domain of Phe-tRNA-synthetase-like protein
MTFQVARACVALGLRAGAIVFRGIHVTDTKPALRAEIGQESALLRTRLADIRAVRTLPEVGAFQEILRKVGIKPRKVQPSVERLLSFALKRGELPAVNSLVDAYNLVSIRSLCSLGAHDLDRMTLPVTLRPLTGAESFTPLGQNQPVTVSPGEFGYVDGAGRVLCRLDVLQADFSKVTTQTVNALLIIEGTAAHASEVLRAAFTEAMERVRRHCGGTAEIVAYPEW